MVNSQNWENEKCGKNIVKRKRVIVFEISHYKHLQLFILEVDFEERLDENGIIEY